MPLRKSVRLPVAQKMPLCKRIFDVGCAALGLLVLWPLFLCVALLVKLDDGGPVLFRQVRVGHKGRPFRLWKFRTMALKADALGASLTIGWDPRVTRSGYWLRKSKLDEFPQLLNVLTGEMSLVGPRPEVPEYVALYTPGESHVLDLVPGITDVASLQYLDEGEALARSSDPERTYVDEVMPEKVRLSLEYAAEATIHTDVEVILRTLVRLFKRTSTVLY